MNHTVHFPYRIRFFVKYSVIKMENSSAKSSFFIVSFKRHAFHLILTKVGGSKAIIRYLRVDTQLCVLRAVEKLLKYYRYTPYKCISWLLRVVGKVTRGMRLPCCSRYFGCRETWKVSVTLETAPRKWTIEVPLSTNAVEAHEKTSIKNDTVKTDCNTPTLAHPSDYKSTMPPIEAQVINVELSPGRSSHGNATCLKRLTRAT